MRNRGDPGAIVAKNVGLSFLSQVWFVVLAIVTTPYIVETLGVDLYGLYIIVTTVLGYFLFLDLGLGAALIRYVAEYHAVDDFGKIGRLIRTALALYLVVGVVGGVLIAVSATFLVDHVLTLDATDTDLAKVAFLIAAVGFMVNLPGQTFSAVPTALQRFDIVFLRTVLLGTASIGGTVVVLALGYGLLAVLTVNLVVTTLTAALFYIRTRRLVPEVSFRPRVFRPELRLLMGFGLLLAAQNASLRIVMQLDRLVVAAVAPIAAVTYYVVPLSLSQRIDSLVGNIGKATFPATSALFGQQDDRRIEELYLRAMKLTALIAIPVATILFVYAHEIMLLWLNAEFEANSSSVLMILALANLLLAFRTVPAVLLASTNRMKIGTAFTLLSATTNLALVLALVPTLGYEGAAWAVLGTAVIQIPPLYWYVHSRVVSVRLAELVRASLLKPLAAAFALVPAMLWVRSQTVSLAGLILVCLATLTAYFGLTFLLGVYDARERALIRSLLRR
jgi:O-antigen/teichoic acid export membrane protein